MGRVIAALRANQRRQVQRGTATTDRAKAGGGHDQVTDEIRKNGPRGLVVRLKETSDALGRPEHGRPGAAFGDLKRRVM